MSTILEVTEMSEEEKLITEDNNKEDKKGPLDGKFCWAGLIMPHIWGICNGVWVGILGFVPFLFPFVALWLGFAGYSMAYKEAEHADKKEEFCKKQKIWNIASIFYVIVFAAIILSVNFDGLTNYVKNKKELDAIITETEEQKARLAEEVEKLTDLDNLNPFVNGMNCTPSGEIQFSESSDLWHLKNSYGYEELSRDNVKFGKPEVYAVSQEFLTDNGSILTITFDVNDNFQIEEGNYSIYSGEEVHMTSPGYYTNLDEIGIYMDKNEIDLILNAD